MPKHPGCRSATYRQHVNCKKMLSRAYCYLLCLHTKPKATHIVTPQKHAPAGAHIQSQSHWWKIWGCLGGGQELVNLMVHVGPDMDNWTMTSPHLVGGLSEFLPRCDRTRDPPETDNPTLLVDKLAIDTMHLSPPHWHTNTHTQTWHETLCCL